MVRILIPQPRTHSSPPNFQFKIICVPFPRFSRAGIAGEHKHQPIEVSFLCQCPPQSLDHDFQFPSLMRRSARDRFELCRAQFGADFGPRGDFENFSPTSARRQASSPQHHRFSGARPAPKLNTKSPCVSSMSAHLVIEIPTWRGLTK